MYDVPTETSIKFMDFPLPEATAELLTRQRKELPVAKVGRRI